MLHAVGRAKPWRRHYTLDALFAHPPDQTHKRYWRHAREPVPVMPEGHRMAAAIALAAAALVRRFYARR